MNVPLLVITIAAVALLYDVAIWTVAYRSQEAGTYRVINANLAVIFGNTIGIGLGVGAMVVIALLK